MTMELEGKVSLDDFAEAMLNLKLMIQTLSMELNADDIDWLIDDLRAGSAGASIRGASEMPGRVEKVVYAFGIVGESLAAGTPIPYSDKVRRRASALTQVIGDGIKVHSPVHGAGNFNNIGFHWPSGPRRYPVCSRHGERHG